MHTSFNDMLYVLECNLLIIGAGMIQKGFRPQPFISQYSGMWERLISDAVSQGAVL